LHHQDNALVTLVAAKENCFHGPFKTIKTVGISKFIWQRVSDLYSAKVSEEYQGALGMGLRGRVG